MSLAEKTKNFRRKHETALVLVAIVASGALGLGLSQLTIKYNAWGRLGSLLTDRTYEQNKVIGIDILTTRFMDQYDLNGDRVVTNEEHSQVVGKNFMNKYDLDQDGSVTAEEYRQVVEENYK